MAYALGIIVMAFGILLAVCLHEAGHMGTAKAFGMKVTRYFVGFGPTIWSFRRGETEYGVKAVPLGGFVKIVGMTPQDDDVAPEDEPRAMWRFPVWKRTIVMSAGSITHFILAIVTLWLVFVVVGVPDFRIVAINGTPVPNSPTLRQQLKTLAGQKVTVTYKRGSETLSGSADIPSVLRVKADVGPNKKANEVTDADLERAGMLGISIDYYSDLPLVRSGPIEGIGQTFSTIGTMVERTFESLKLIPQKIPKLLSAIAGEKRDPETPVSVVGASRIGGELFEIGDWTSMLTLFATLNLFFGIFNLFPLLPMDGGHIAIAWFERVRSWLAAKRGRPDPGRVDYVKLAPITIGVIGILGVFVLLTVTADIINPITLR